MIANVVRGSDLALKINAVRYLDVSRMDLSFVYTTDICSLWHYRQPLLFSWLSVEVRTCMFRKSVSRRKEHVVNSTSKVWISPLWRHRCMEVQEPGHHRTHLRRWPTEALY